MQKERRTQLSSIKPDFEKICKNVKQWHSSHYFLERLVIFNKKA